MSDVKDDGQAIQRWTAKRRVALVVQVVCTRNHADHYLALPAVCLRHRLASSVLSRWGSELSPVLAFLNRLLLYFVNDCHFFYKRTPLLLALGLIHKHFKRLFRQWRIKNHVLVVTNCL